MALYDFTAKLGTGQEQSLAAYRGQALLIVNVASKCGFTPQHKGLQALHDEYAARGFAVLAFPCDQFGHQEPGSDQEIAAFYDRSFGVTFPLFAKIEVNGPCAHPLYVRLKQQKGGLLGSGIKWNLIKFLVNRVGLVRSRFAPTTTPEGLAREVAALIESCRYQVGICPISCGRRSMTHCFGSVARKVLEIVESPRFCAWLMWRMSRTYMAGPRLHPGRPATAR